MRELKRFICTFVGILGPVGVAVAVLVPCAVVLLIPSLVGPLSVLAWVWVAIGSLVFVKVLFIVTLVLRVTVFAPDWVERYPNGKVRARGPHYHGDRQEHWTFWHEDGWKECEGEYVAGFEWGIWTFYHSNGQGAARGELDGWSRRGAWEFWDDTGGPLGEAEFLARYSGAAGRRFPPRGADSAAGEASQPKLVGPPDTGGESK